MRNISIIHIAYINIQRSLKHINYLNNFNKKGKCMKQVVIILTGILFITAGCSIHKPIINSHVGRKHPEISGKSVSFPHNYKGMALKEEPVTWVDYYNGGTYLFEKGEYGLALNYFQKGANISEGEPRRLCLAAAAICALGANDAEQFLQIMKELKRISNNPFKKPNNIDRVIEALDEIERY